MKVRKAKDEKPKTQEKQVLLRDVEPGQLFRSPRTTYAAAMRKPGQSFFYRIKPPSGAEKTNKVSIISADMMLSMERDDDHMVVVHDCVLEISRAATEPIPVREDLSDLA